MFKRLQHISFIVISVIMILLIITSIVFPDIYKQKIPYRFYTVLTNSMEPKIPVNSLVLVKTYQKDMEIKNNDIITFRAKRFGEPIVITHRFSHTETNEDGLLVYKTHPELSQIIDPYETTQDDLLGIYVFHIPYLGKMLLFLKSPFGFLWLCEMIVILLVKETLKARWNESIRNEETIIHNT